jgi:uncharacterized membrane-anchored protein
MQFWSEPTEASGYGLGQLREIVQLSFSSQAETYRTLEFLLGALDTLVYVLVAVTVLAFAVYLTLWALSGANDERRQKAVEGATRSFAAIFLMVNIWGIVRVVNMVTYISPLTEYLIFLVFFLILGAWSLFNIGAGFVGLLAGVVNAIVAGVARLIARIPGESRFAQRIRSVRPGTLQFFVIILAALTMSPFWIPTVIADRAGTFLPPEVATAETAGEEGIIEGTTYTGGGFSVTYPDDWTLSSSEAGNFFEASRGAIQSRATLYMEDEGAESYLYSRSWRLEQIGYYMSLYESTGWNIYDIKAWEAGPGWYAITLMASAASDYTVVHEATYVYVALPGRMYLFTFEHDGAREDAAYLFEAIAPILETVRFE